MKTEQLIEIISILGEDRVKRVYGITKSEKISFATLNKEIKNRQIETAINSGSPFRLIAKHYNISRMSIYRILKNRILKRSSSKKIVTDNHNL